MNVKSPCTQNLGLQGTSTNQSYKNGLDSSIALKAICLDENMFVWNGVPELFTKYNQQPKRKKENTKQSAICLCSLRINATKNVTLDVFIDLNYLIGEIDDPAHPLYRPWLLFLFMFVLKYAFRRCSSFI